MRQASRGNLLMQNPRGIAPIGAVEVQLKDRAVLDLNSEVRAMVPAPPIFFRCRTSKPPVIPGMLYGDDPIFLFPPDKRYRLSWNALAANSYFLADESWHSLRFATPSHEREKSPRPQATHSRIRRGDCFRKITPLSPELPPEFASGHEGGRTRPSSTPQNS